MSFESPTQPVVRDADLEAERSRPGAKPVDPGPPSPEDLLREIDDLRKANLKLVLELQVERVRQLEEPAGIAERLHRAWAGLGGRSWEQGEPGAAVRAVAAVYSRIVPTREGAPAARWSLSRVELAALVVILVAGVLLRFVDLANTPPGVQGDEAAIAIEGQRIRADGWIGPYSPIAAGTPTGALYAVALAQVWFGDSILTVRLVSAFFGSLTILVLFFVVRRSFGSVAGVLSAGLLAVMGWHIHYSRLGFPNILWPCFVVAGLGALVEAVRDNDRRYWALAGLLFGLGVYTYNAHVIVLLLTGGYLAFLTFGPAVLLLAAALGLATVKPGILATGALAAAVAALIGGRAKVVRNRMTGLAIFAAVLIAVALPMIRYASDESNNYFGYSERLSVVNSEEWDLKSGTGERIRWVTGRYVDYWDRMCCEPVFDGVDATGTVPVVPLATLLLAAAGLVLSLWRGYRMLATMSAILLFVLPFTSVMSVDFALRRTMIESVFLAMFAGVGIARLAQIGWNSRYGRYALIPLVGLIAVVSVRQNLDDYFNGTLVSSEVRWVNAVEMVAASEYIGDLPPGSYVYFMADRWPYSHEIRRYFAPGVPGEDRTERFGEDRLPYDPANGRPVYILIGSYEERLADLQRMYPGGDVAIEGTPEDPVYIAYLPPWPQSNPADPAPATPVAGDG